MEKKKRKYDLYKVLYTTFIGSVIATFGMSNTKSPMECRKAFNVFKSEVSKKADLNFTTSIDEIVDWLVNFWNLDESTKEAYWQHSVLVYDEKNIFTPLVANWIYVDGILTILPIDPKGVSYGILAYVDMDEMSDRIRFYFLDEVEDEIEE